MKIKTNNQSAFTLIEMILAVGVAAIVLVAVNVTLFTALRLRAATTAAVDANSPVDATVSYIKRDLACAMTPINDTTKVLSGNFKTGTVTSDGIAEPVAVEMFTATGALSENQPWGEVQRVTYELKSPTTRDAIGKDLYRSVTRNLLALNTPDVTDQLMLSGVESVKFSGYDGSQWLDTWDTSDTTSINTNLPLAVRVQIQMAGNVNAQPIQIVVPMDCEARTNMVLTTTGS